MNRRHFLQTSAAATAILSTGTWAAEGPTPSTLPDPQAAKLPRWRGFNLTELTNAEWHKPFREADFEWMAEWGFNFARLPLSYRCWADKDDWLKLKEDGLKLVDQAVEFGKRHGLHTNLNLHRAPGYCVNPPKEPLSLWQDESALEACAFHWGQLARRFKGIPNRQVSFDLLNEPANVKEEVYVRVVKRLVAAIRAEDPGRLIVADGLDYGRNPVFGLADLGVAQSTRGYDPMHVSHYKASWAGGIQGPEPTWPLKPGAPDEWNRARLFRERIEPWLALAKKGVGIHVGEWGFFQHTPHKVGLAWMRDQLELWRDAGWGWSLWNFRGSFGVLDSGRSDVIYEDHHGHKLDRAMLDLLRAN